MNNPNPVVTIIPATIDRQTLQPLMTVTKRRVAAYARVSTDDEDQEQSYKAQKEVFDNRIKSNPEWEHAGIYADKGISGTGTKKRKNFNLMVQDALDGKIDLILAKSVSRFARNTVDSLNTIRVLKEKGVEVYFEKENIWTLDAKGELLITIMSSLAQEESRSISENVSWGHHARMQEGKVNIPYKSFLGYAQGEDGKPVIVESEAEIVRQIYDRFVEGRTIREIAAWLTEQGIPTPRGHKIWSVSTVNSILQNEKYAGMAILQKKFTVDFLTKKVKVNNGELPRYIVQNSHPAIIPLHIYDLVQGEIRRRKAMGKGFNGSGLFYAKVICGQCRGKFGPKLWHSNDKYRRTVWLCNSKYGISKNCTTPHLSEEQIRNVFVEAWNRLLADKKYYIKEYTEATKNLSDTSALDEEIAGYSAQCKKLADQAKKDIRQNAHTAQDQKEYIRRHDELTAQFDAAKEKFDALMSEKQDRIFLKECIRFFLELIRQTTVPLDAFDERLFRMTAEYIMIRSTDDITVRFRSGTEICVNAEN